MTMFNMLRTAALSAVVGLTALTGMAATAQADGLYLNFGGGESRVGVYVGDHGPRWRHDRWDRRDRWERRECTPRRAVDKAERLGVRRARVVDVGRRTIDVAGRRHGERVIVTFARAPHCPIIR
jgi:ABC-type sugar transport system substrate-binding protein